MHLKFIHAVSIAQSLSVLIHILRHFQFGAIMNKAYIKVEYINIHM